ncbi:hypothetical protein B4R45_08100 [Acinetobacter baumannii]|uniref:Uncharacterized protein n=3 Tax=Acinetobacter baumannii TaxID=470 RepID=A0A482F2Y0_ACIBA|nr:hypothetical protein ABTJ_p2051 [Acinetobacter baumannii MDR-TJ]AKJ47831.1 hypothetical protein TE32_19785 [Acinetobacter baumannii]AXQ92250.1 hypothetical protein BSF95_05050 [Acinetobacter baumannii WM99c]AYY19674.1 hypothetical protein EG364_20465 [Acinetobacter sp. FDAARGOS_560]EJG16252.1 hypothetical protein ACIN5189_A3952 [Acinetobacter baumannii OIFC189]EMT91908.1 hypothetical protein ABNIH26_01593 [Acinetobacter baumannii ABNIH26]EMU11158.1 hypothetical protein ABNIH13_07432 [Acine
MKEKLPRFIYTDLGKEKLCIECKSYFPLDEEFFYWQWHTNKNGRSKRFTATCKGCYDIRYRPWRLAKRKKAIKSSYEERL